MIFSVQVLEEPVAGMVGVKVKSSLRGAPRLSKYSIDRGRASPDWPVAVLPLILMTLGFSWMLASLGVYLRDVAQVIGVVTLVLMSKSPAISS